MPVEDPSKAPKLDETKDIAIVGNTLARYLYRDRVSLLFTKPATKYVSQ